MSRLTSNAICSNACSTVRRFFALGCLVAMQSLQAQAAQQVAMVADTAQASFPGAVGWAAQTPGGRGGKIIRVTNLNADGPGSLKEAIETAGPRIVVFEVGGVIDLKRSTLTIREPFITIAGQTAPSPGITIIRGGLILRGHDAIIRHLRVRTGVD